MKLDEELKAWRERAKLSQTKAAAALGLPVRTLQHIEQGRNFRNPQLLLLAIEALEGRENGAA
jgi:transcriptional regulator with XRE-family HTH domain